MTPEEEEYTILSDIHDTLAKLYEKHFNNKDITLHIEQMIHLVEDRMSSLRAHQLTKLN